MEQSATYVTFLFFWTIAKHQIEHSDIAIMQYTYQICVTVLIPYDDNVDLAVNVKTDNGIHALKFGKTHYKSACIINYNNLFQLHLIIWSIDVGRFHDGWGVVCCTSLSHVTYALKLYGTSTSFSGINITYSFTHRRSDLSWQVLQSSRLAWTSGNGWRIVVHHFCSQPVVDRHFHCNAVL